MIIHLGLISNVFLFLFSFFFSFRINARAGKRECSPLGQHQQGHCLTSPLHPVTQMIRYSTPIYLFISKMCILTIQWAALSNVSLSSSSSSASLYGSSRVPVPCTFTPFLFYPFENSANPPTFAVNGPSHVFVEWCKHAN